MGVASAGDLKGAAAVAVARRVRLGEINVCKLLAVADVCVAKVDLRCAQAAALPLGKPSAWLKATVSPPLGFAKKSMITPVKPP